jgi:hypothetical protein
LLFPVKVEPRQGESFVSLENRVRIKISDLNLEWLEKYPIWSWYEGSPYECEDEIYPIHLDEDKVSLLHTLFISALFTTHEGLEVSGSMTLDVASKVVYGIELFHKGENFGFNMGLPDMALTEIDRLKSFLGDQNLEIFPISYKALADIDSIETLAGTFAIQTE